jgi:hypothetical protein
MKKEENEEHIQQRDWWLEHQERMDDKMHVIPK